ncbi:ABC transporter ATP-binding protein [Enterococcus cecorum]|uniref:ABC transporter ATP-binding protein n=1 Tax=Enterococcus cecorum TaxID=44008 RepID=A0AAW9JHT2_9ENTE|nr:ABC transporter ATP-binding protein [Enterococcus cecorum]MCJ0544239.1 ABC transporter ATP-binding protein [Enterococcus cecorum]MCJ0549059.1 ABC transporter ATP-binding protein [Enterococcus cecorum]MCJ0565084.1 ABC transporter ATP-binding protein [Enterococcus cecorum]MDZ5503391.1 ABC transporter ATP-binding protein [Enterococcus cecorum]MDZ5530822.1 ABC transporter ATP-binding protein [Enterococcus cecorum]
MIEVIHADKFYDQKQALKDVNLTIKNGTVFGLLGHNGAGKSTLIKSLVSAHDLTNGKIKVDGQELTTHRQEIKQKIGYVPDSPDLFLQLTAMEYWRLMIDIYRLNYQDVAAKMQEYIQLFSMKADQNTLISSMSHGMRQKVILIGALTLDPDIWILDEPLTGLDPQSAFELKELIKKHVANGNTVIFSTHILAIAQEVCDELAILKKGEVIYSGTVEDLLASQPGKTLEEIYLSMTGEEKVGEAHE